MIQTDVIIESQLSIDGLQIFYVPKTLKWKDSIGEKKVYNTISGSNNKLVEGIDSSTRIGSVSFSLKPTNENIENYDTLKLNDGTHTIDILKPGIRIRFEGCTLINKIEWGDDADSDVSFEFQGNRI